MDADQAEVNEAPEDGPDVRGDKRNPEPVVMRTENFSTPSGGQSK